MLFTILVGLVVVVMVIAFVFSLGSDGLFGAFTAAGIFGLPSGVVAFFVFCLGSMIIVGSRVVDTEWSEISEVAYTVAEKSDVTADNSRVSFFTEKDGKLEEVRLSGVDSVKSEPGDGGETTVTVIELHREIGTAIFPWGEGEERTLVVVKN